MYEFHICRHNSESKCETAQSRQANLRLCNLGACVPDTKAVDQEREDRDDSCHCRSMKQTAVRRHQDQLRLTRSLKFTFHGRTDIADSPSPSDSRKSQRNQYLAQGQAHPTGRVSNLPSPEFQNCFPLRFRLSILPQARIRHSCPNRSRCAHRASVAGLVPVFVAAWQRQLLDLAQVCPDRLLVHHPNPFSISACTRSSCGFA